MGEKIGIIGGLGPMATVYFMQRIVEMTEASADQEHLEIIAYNVPTIPDRTGYILGKEGCMDPAPKMKEINKKLEDENVTCVAIPCMTAHHFYDEVVGGITNRVIHGVRESSMYLKEMGMSKVGLMATDGTIQTGLFQKELDAVGIRLVTPDEENQKKVMKIIYEQVKAGKSPDMELFESVSEHLKSNGAQVIILGCTEFSLVKRDNVLSDGYLDVIDVLAMRCVKTCNKLKIEFTNLITK